MLEINNVSFCYKKDQFAVKDVSFAVNDGEFIAIAGRNGSGKTTVTRLVMSLLKPVAGSIVLDGKDTAKFGAAEMARQVGYVFQNPDRQIFRDTVAKEIAYGPEQLGFSPEEVKTAVERALKATGLEGLGEVYPRRLSKGQRQRVAIASALAMNPRLLILDEPTSGQDASEKIKLLDLLAELNAGGMTILLVTHDMELLGRYARRVIVMAEGHKVFDGTPVRLFTGGHDFAAWSLREPSAVRIAQGLLQRGIPPAAMPERLNPEAIMTGGGPHA